MFEQRSAQGTNCVALFDSWQGRRYWKQARMIAKHHDGSWTQLISTWNPAISTKQKGYRKQGRPARSREDDNNLYPQPTIVHRDDDTTFLLRGTWLEMGLRGKRLCEQQTQTTNTTAIVTTGTAKPTAAGHTTHDSRPRPRRRRRHRRRRRRHTTHPLPTHRKLILRRPKQQQATNTQKTKCATATLFCLRFPG